MAQFPSTTSAYGVWNMMDVRDAVMGSNWPIAFSAPGAPTGVTATAGAGQATVSFTAPSSTGGSPITGYTVTSSPGGITASGASSPITVSGLTNGTAYTFTVTATNAIGTGPASAPSNSVTPTYSPSFTYVGNIGTSAVEIILSVPISGSTVFALALSSSPYGTSTLYRSTNGGASWTVGGSVAGSGSAYGQGILAISDSVVIVQNRGYFYRSTDAGSTFSLILATGGGQNNFFTISSDGTYGVCAGYSRNVITSDNWVSASAVGSPFGIVMATAALTNNGGNAFLHAPLGSSGSPYTAYVATASGSSTIASFGVGGNQSIACSNPTNGFNAFMNIPEGAASGNVYYATYPSTSYTAANLSGISWGWTGFPAVTPDNKILCPFSNGLWSVRPGTTPLLVSSFTNFGSACLDVSGARNFAVRLTGEVYRY